MVMIKRLLSIGAIVATVAVAGACGNGPNPADRAEQALKDANLNDVKVSWDNSARVAHLKGQVGSPADRTRAEEVASTAVGTSGQISNELVVAGMEAEHATDMDGQIRDQLHRMVADDPLLKDKDVTFEVKNGAVTITGQVDSVAQKNRVEELAKAVPGVKAVTNALGTRVPDQSDQTGTRRQ
jgi:osmotically-inducible protein OsmY